MNPTEQPSEKGARSPALVSVAAPKGRVQFSTRTLLIVVLSLSGLLAWMNWLAAWADAPLTEVIAGFVFGFVTWSFFGLIAGTAYAVGSVTNFLRPLALSLLPGIPVGIVFTTCALLRLSYDWRLIGYFGTGWLSTLILFAYLASKSNTMSPSSDLRVLSLMSLVWLASLFSNLVILFGELPIVFDEKIVIYLVARNPPPIPVGTPIMKSGITVGYVSEVKSTDEPEVQVLKLRVHKGVHLYMNEVLDFTDPASGAPPAINFVPGPPNPGYSDQIEDGATIYCELK